MSASFESDPTSSFAKGYFETLRRCLDEIRLDDLEPVLDLLSEAFAQRTQVFIVGNGGSAATASHMVCDLGKTIGGNPQEDSVGLRAIALTENVSTITAWANDVDYRSIFASQLNNLAEKGDILIVISASGDSPNILAVAEAAKRHEMKIIGLLGRDGGAVAKFTDYSFIVQSTDYGPIEDAHLAINHMITAYLKQSLTESSTK